MPVIKSAKKKMRQAEKHAKHNREIRDVLKEKIKSIKNLAGKKSSEVQKKLSEAFSEIDRAAKRNIIHKNAASRKKSRLAKLIITKKTIESKAGKTEKPKSQKKKTTPKKKTASKIK